MAMKEALDRRPELMITLVHRAGIAGPMFSLITSSMAFEWPAFQKTDVRCWLKPDLPDEKKIDAVGPTVMIDE